MLLYLVTLASHLRQSPHATVSPQPDHESRSAAPHLHTAPLLTTNDPLRTLFLPHLCFHEVTNCSPGLIDLEVPYFHNLTSCFFRKCFVFIRMQVARGCALSPSFAPPSRFRLAAPFRQNFLHDEGTIHYSLPTARYPLPTTHYSLLTTHYPLSDATHYPLLTFRNRMIAYETR